MTFDYENTIIEFVEEIMLCEKPKKVRRSTRVYFRFVVTVDV